MQRALRAAIRNVDRKRPLPSADGAEIRHVPVQPHQPQEAFHNARRLAKRHADRTFIVRQVWIEASLNARDLPLLPEGSAPHFISGSNQIVSDPRRFSAAL